MAMPTLAVTTSSLPLDVERLAEGGLRAARDLLGLVARQDSVEQDRELVAADPGHGVAGTERSTVRRRAVATSSWSPTAWLKPSLTTLKRSRSRNRTAHWCSGSRSRSPQGLRQPIEEQGAVRQAGEGVVKRVVNQLLLGRLAIGDVRHRARHPSRLAVCRRESPPAAEHPPVAAVGMPDPMLALEVRGAAREVRLDLRLAPARRRRGARDQASPRASRRSRRPRSP